MSDYRDVIQNPKIAFKNYELQNGIVKQTPLGLPFLVSGGFALTACVTTQVNGTGSKWAIRCFHKEVIDLQERYQYISNFLQNKNYDFFVNFQYEIEGIQFQSKWYPIVKMAWVEGISLSEYIQDNLENSICLNNLTNQIKLISHQLNALKMAHGDIQHGNVLVRDDGRCILIDYDGMYVPGMPYNNSNELGHVAFQHPGRNNSFFNEKIDRFSTIIFYVSLLSLATLGKDIWKKYHTGENLIFSRKDYQDPENSAVFSELLHNSKLSPLISRLQKLCRCRIEDIPTLDDFLNFQVNLSSLKVAASLPLISSFNDGTVVFSAKEILKLVKQEGEKITVVGKIASLYFANENLLFINFGNFANIVKNYSSFTIVIFSKGLASLRKVRNIDKDELKNLNNQYLKITGILELYANKKGCITPQIVLEDPYQIQILTQNEAKDILDAFTTTTNILQPLKPVPPKTSPVPTITAVPVQQPSSLPPKPIPPQATSVKPTQTQPFVSSPPKQTASSVQPVSTPQKPQPISTSTSNTTPPSDDCFIATAAYESRNHPDVETFRTFRDQFLLKHTLGKYLVIFYYFVGPHLAKLVLSNLLLKSIVRRNLGHLAQLMRVKKIV